MYRTITISFLLLILSLPVFAARTVVTQTPYYNPYHGAYWGGDYIPQYSRQRNNSIFSDINALEKYAMNRNFTRDSDRTRLERLETIAYGAVQQGDIITRYNNVREAILTRPKQNYKTSLLKSIGNYFNGQLTGFTPDITDSGLDLLPYGQSSSGSRYSSPWSRSEIINNYDSKSGTGIKILD